MGKEKIVRLTFKVLTTKQRPKGQRKSLIRYKPSGARRFQELRITIFPNRENCFGHRADLEFTGIFAKKARIPFGQI